MIKLALICTDEALEVRLRNLLCGDKDIIVSGFIVIQNVTHESDRVKGRDFMNKMIGLQPDIIILEMTLLREVAALYLPRLMEFKRNATPCGPSSSAIAFTANRGSHDEGRGARFFTERSS